MKNNFSKAPLLLSIIFFIFFSFLFVFFYKKTNDNDQRAKQNMSTWQIEADKREAIRSLNRSVQEVSEERTLLETHFAKNSNVVPFLDTLEALALKVGARAEVNLVDNLPDNAGLVVGLKASGSFEAIYKFLTLLENSPYELDFLSADVHKLVATNEQSANVKNLKWEALFKIQLLSFVP